MFLKFHLGSNTSRPIPLYYLYKVLATSMQSMIDTIYIGMAQTWIHLHTDRAILSPVSQSPYPLINMHIHCTQRKDSLSHIITRTQMYIYDICMFICMCVVIMQIEQQLKHLPTQQSGLEKRLSTA